MLCNTVVLCRGILICVSLLRLDSWVFLCLLQFRLLFFVAMNVTSIVKQIEERKPCAQTPVPFVLDIQLPWSLFVSLFFPTPSPLAACFVLSVVGNTLQTLMMVLLPCSLSSSIMLISCFPWDGHCLEAISDKGPVPLQSSLGEYIAGVDMTSTHFVTCRSCLSQSWQRLEGVWGLWLHWWCKYSLWGIGLIYISTVKQDCVLLPVIFLHQRKTQTNI